MLEEAAKAQEIAKMNQRAANEARKITESHARTAVATALLGLRSWSRT